MNTKALEEDMEVIKGFPNLFHPLVIKEKIHRAIKSALKCMEIVKGLPSEKEIRKLIWNTGHKLLDSEYQNLAIQELAKALHKRIRSEK